MVALELASILTYETSMMKRRAFMQRTAGLGAVMLGGCAARSSSEEQEAIMPENVTYRLPEEADPHQRTFMQWPVHADIYEGRRYLRDAQQSIALIARTIAEFEPVTLMADARHHEEISAQVGEAVTLWDIPTDDLWCRDAGPLFVKDEADGLAIMDFNFNGWGGKQRHSNDAHVARRVAERLELPHFDSGVVGEPGGLEFDGEGTIIAHESSWANPNRNSIGREEIGVRLMRAVGAEHVIWAPGVLGGDITDYHIDALARFIRPGVVVIQLPDAVSADNPWSAAAYETYEILQEARDAEGRALEIVTLPEPVDIRSRARDFVASYVNYYVCNGAVIAAEFGDERADAEARETLGALYPGREIVMLNVDPIGESGGGIHCATQQQPA